MSEFFKAALPWIAIGIAVALFAVNHIKDKIQTSEEKKEKTENCQSEGMSIGMCLGVVFGTTGVCDLATGISIGMLLGLVIGKSIKK